MKSADRAMRRHAKNGRCSNCDPWAVRADQAIREMLGNCPVVGGLLDVTETQLTVSYRQNWKRGIKTGRKSVIVVEASFPQ
jgi:hypothetical protein